MDPNTTPGTPVPPPQQQPVTPPNSPSYLDVIAEPVKDGSKLFGIFPKKILLIAGGVLALLVAVIVIISIMNNIQKAANARVTALGTRINELRVIIQYRDNNPISSNVIATVAAETDIIVVSYLMQLAEAYPVIDPEGYLEEKQVPAIIELNDAKARGNLDSAYAEVLYSQLSSTCDQLEVLLQDKSTSDAQKETLNKAYDDFKELASRLPAIDN
jgi:hypothetical protein